MNNFIKTGKDKIKKKEHSNVVYKINYHSCSYSYVGQTKRKLRTRLKEQINNLKKSTNFLSVISRHKLDHDHTINWKNVNILNSEQSYYKRMVSEMIHIKRQDYYLNKVTQNPFLKSYQSSEKSLLLIHRTTLSINILLFFYPI